MQCLLLRTKWNTYTFFANQTNFGKAKTGWLIKTVLAKFLQVRKYLNHIHFVQFSFLIRVSTLGAYALYEKHIKCSTPRFHKQHPFYFWGLQFVLTIFRPRLTCTLFSNCLSELDRQLLPSYCLFIRSVEITRETVVLPASGARSNGRKCFSSTYSPKWSMRYLSCACALHTDVVRVRDTIWTFSSMGLRWPFGLLDFRRILECVAGGKLYFCLTVL